MKKQVVKKSQIELTILTDAIDLNLGNDRTINIYDTMKALPQFNQMRGVFQQFSLQSVTVKVFPRREIQDSNTDYGITRITIITNPTSRIDPDTNKLGRTVCPVTKSEVIKFTTSGRQNDFHYWFDTDNLDVGPSCAVLVGNLRDSTTETYKTTLQIGFTVQFRYPCVHLTGNENRVEYKYVHHNTEPEEEEEKKDKKKKKTQYL